MIFGLLAGTGMRISEALNLRCDDVDLDQGVLTVRLTKFRKSRLVPLHPTVGAKLRSYSAWHRQTITVTGEAFFFLSRMGRQIGRQTVEKTFRQIRSDLGWQCRGGHPAPRIHDLRHTFICRRVQLWQANGANIDNAVAALATYVGHTRVWIRPEEITVDDVHALVNNAVNELNKANATNEKIKGPSKRSIYRMIAQLTGYTITERKQGKRKADIQFRSVSLGPEPERPLEEVEIDHHLLDLNVLDDKYGNLLGRPWLTLALDRATRMIVGYHLGLAAPNYTSVMECLRHAMAQKNLDRHRPFVRHDWDVFGKIERIVLDNGKEFHCNSLKTACSDMNIGITYTAKRSPWLKGKVERFFGTLETGLVHKIPGTTFSNPMARGDYLSGERACLTFSEAEQAICKFIVDIYSNNLHTGINAIPRLRWEELTDRYPILPVTPEDLDVLLHHVLYVDVSAKGIRMYGLLYQDTYKLAELRSIPGIDKYLFTVKLDPADLSAIRVLDPVTRTYSIIQSSDPKYTEGLTLDQHLRIRDYTRAKLKRTITIDDLCQSKAELFAFIDERASKRGISKTGRVFIGDPKKRATRPSRNQAPPDQASNASNTEKIPTVKIEHDNTTTEHFIDDDDNEFGEIEATFGISAIYRK